MSLLAVNPTPALDASRADAGGATESAQVRALLQLRELILSGELAGGSRIAELAIVERLGVSRTPIRAALMRLEQEGLLEALPNGGYVVQTFSERDISDAIELRGTLEGLLARLAAERGAPAGVLTEARTLLDGIDAEQHALAQTTGTEAFEIQTQATGILHGADRHQAYPRTTRCKEVSLGIDTLETDLNDFHAEWPQCLPDHPIGRKLLVADHDLITVISARRTGLPRVSVTSTRS